MPPVSWDVRALDHERALLRAGSGAIMRGVAGKAAPWRRGLAMKIRGDGSNTVR